MTRECYDGAMLTYIQMYIHIILYRYIDIYVNMVIWLINYAIIGIQIVCSVETTNISLLKIT